MKSGSYRDEAQRLGYRFETRQTLGEEGKGSDDYPPGSDKWLPPGFTQ